jgi:hypothetical protein
LNRIKNDKLKPINTNDEETNNCAKLESTLRNIIIYVEKIGNLPSNRNNSMNDNNITIAEIGLKLSPFSENINIKVRTSSNISIHFSNFFIYFNGDRNNCNISRSKMKNKEDNRNASEEAQCTVLALILVLLLFSVISLDGALLNIDASVPQKMKRQIAIVNMRLKKN